MGVFSAKQGPNTDAKRNTFDLSFSNNLTMQFGKIYPVFVKPCDPGDSFNIKASFGLNFLPTVYPVQTPMKAYLHFFYCRNRTVWDDFMNFYTMKDRVGQNLGSSELIPPYINFFGRQITPSSLYDYLGIPVLSELDKGVKSWSFTATPFVYTKESSSLTYHFGGFTFSKDTSVATYDYSATNKTFTIPNSTVFFPSYVSTMTASEPNKPPFFGLTPGQISSQILRDTGLDCSFKTTIAWQTPSASWVNGLGITPEQLDDVNLTIDRSLTVTAGTAYLCIPLFDSTGLYLGYIRYADFSSPIEYSWSLSDDHTSMYLSVNVTGQCSFTPTSQNDRLDKTVTYLGTPCLIISDSYENLRVYDNFLKKLRIPSSSPTQVFNRTSMPTGSTRITFLSTKFEYVSAFTSSNQKSPFFDSVNNPNGLRISSIPFRHYEAICNYFYRDNRNNPLRDGQGNPVYNEVLLGTDGGVDGFNYQFHYHNWEQDFLTTCVQEPQLGVAPLVGISSLGEATFANEDGSTTKVQLTYGEDGNTVTGWKATDGVSAPVAQSLIQMASQGISITDFRNVNAFQTWLEVQMRKTLRFGDSIQGHFNVNPRYDEYLYPEFIGGVTQDVDTYQVNQTVPTESSPLGAYAGQAICKGQVPRSISKFCDEPGYIIGLLSLVPRPVYSQILPKHYLRHETLDYHFPEFNNISYQPVLYSEVSPWLSYNESPELLNKVFGYQRPWYDLISSIDEAHGQFLSTLNGFILRREFVSTPQLSSRFLTVHPEDLNDIFATQMKDSNDVVLGQLYFDVKKKTTISKFGIPSLQV